MLLPFQRHALVSPPAWLCRSVAAFLIIAISAAHIAYLFLKCPLDLAPDEAHYWDWSRHLDWSYYSKGPLIAWIIRAGCELFGPLSVALTGDLMPAIRLPAVLCSALMLASVYVLTVQVTGRDGLALAIVALALTLPVVSAGSFLMTIDAPYTCCWGWALVFTHRAVFRGSAWAWPAAGLAIALGFLAKYTMVIFVPSLALFLLTQAEYRERLAQPGFWVLCGVASLGALPVLIWNAQHQWVTFRHVGGLAVSPDRAGIQWLGPIVFLGGQFALMLGFWFAFWLSAMVAHNPLREENAGLRYLWWMSATMFAVFAGFSLKNGGGELNWPITMYVSGMILTAFYLARLLESPTAIIRRLTMFNLALASLIGLSLTVAVHHTEWLHPVMDRWVGPATPQNPMPVRRLDPTCRLRGWQTLAAEIDRLRADLGQDGSEPLLAGTSWSLPGALGVYCAGHPQAYSFGLAQGDRHSQYDMWTNPLDEPELFRGRTFIIVGGVAPRLASAFEEVEPTRLLMHSQNGRALAWWPITICRGYKGVMMDATENGPKY